MSFFSYNASSFNCSSVKYSFSFTAKSLRSLKQTKKKEIRGRLGSLDRVLRVSSLIFESHGRLARWMVCVEPPLTPHPWERREAMKKPSVRRGVWEKQQRYRRASRAPQRSYSPQDPVEMSSVTGEADPWRHFAALERPSVGPELVVLHPYPRRAP